MQLVCRISSCRSSFGYVQSYLQPRSLSSLLSRLTELEQDDFPHVRHRLYARLFACFECSFVGVAECGRSRGVVLVGATKHRLCVLRKSHNSKLAKGNHP